MDNMIITELDLAWEAINALGGGTFSKEDVVINEVVGRALAEIEKLGGSDPAHRRWLQKQYAA